MNFFVKIFLHIWATFFWGVPRIFSKGRPPPPTLSENLLFLGVKPKHLYIFKTFTGVRDVKSARDLEISSSPNIGLWWCDHIRPRQFNLLYSILFYSIYWLMKDYADEGNLDQLSSYSINELTAITKFQLARPHGNFYLLRSQKPLWISMTPRNLMDT